MLATETGHPSVYFPLRANHQLAVHARRFTVEYEPKDGRLPVGGQSVFELSYYHFVSA